MKEFAIYFGLAFCLLRPLGSWAQVKPRSSETLECSKAASGKPLSGKTERLTNSKKSNDAYATVELARDATDAAGRTCIATYTLYMSQYSQNYRVVKTFSVELRDMAGVDLIGFSDDDSKLAADFWWAAGDYKGHRPVVYDLKSKTARLTELSDQITSQLPACAYSEEFVGISDKGEAVIHVPKSVHVDTGCPDQGNWLFDPKTGAVLRAP